MSADDTRVTEGGDGHNGGPPKRDNKNLVIIGLAVLATALVGTIIGFVLTSDDPEEPEVAPTTVPQTTIPVAPTSTETNDTTIASTAPPATLEPGQLLFIATEDTFTDAMEPSDVNGLAPILEIENEPPEIKTALVRFEVGEMPEGDAMEGARLEFSTISPGSTVAVHLVDGDWSEAETNASNAPALGERVGLIQPGGQAGTVVELDVTEYVTGPGRFDFYLTSIGDETTEYASREAGSGAPAMIITHGS